MEERMRIWIVEYRRKGENWQPMYGDDALFSTRADARSKAQRERATHPNRDTLTFRVTPYTPERKNIARLWMPPCPTSSP